MIFVNNRERKQKILSGKEVKKMKRMCVLTIAALMLIGTVCPNAIALDGTITGYESTQHVHIEYDPFGNAVYSKTVTTTKITKKDADGNVSTDTEVTTVEATFKNGSLKTDYVHSKSTRVDSKGKVLSENEYTDTYKYVNGYLDSVSGSGTSKSYSYDKDGNFTGSSSGTIKRTFIVKNGQALLTSSVTEGTTYDKDGKRTGTFKNTTTIAEADYKYLGGSWVPMKQVTVSRSDSDNGSWEETTRTTTYERNAQGVIIGISQTLTGTRVTVTGATGAGEVSQITEEIRNYVATPTRDSVFGWYISSEDYDWKVTSEIRNPSGHSDPALYGTVTTVEIDGVTYIGIRAELIDLLDGNGLQDAEGEVWILTGELAEELKDLIGQKVMVMGDIAESQDGNYVLNIREDYGGGIVTENVEQTLATYQQASWYQNNLAVMSKVWAEVETKYGSHSTWRQGVGFLMLLFGLK